MAGALADIRREIQSIGSEASTAQTGTGKLADALRDVEVRVKEATERIEDLRAKSGLDSKNSAVANASAELSEMRSLLQYLKDTAAGPDRVAAQQRKIEEVSKKLDEAQRLQRVTEFEFTHSAEYKAQQEAIERAKAAEEQLKKQAETPDLASDTTPRVAGDPFLRIKASADVAGLSQRTKRTVDVLSDFDKQQQKVLAELEKLNAFGGFVKMSDILSKLAEFSKLQNELFKQGKANDYVYVIGEIKKLVDAIQTWGGEPGKRFNFESFKKIISMPSTSPDLNTLQSTGRIRT